MATIKTRPDIELRLVPTPVSITYANGTGNLGGPSLRAAYYVKETSTGVRRRKPQGWLAPTGYTFERSEIYSAGESRWSPYWTTTKAYGQWYKGVAYSVPGEPVGRDQAEYLLHRPYSLLASKGDDGLRNAALIAARNKLKTTQVDLGLAFAERKQTQKLVGDTAIRLARSFQHLKRGQTRKAMDELGISSRRSQPRGSNVPQKWLEMQYGWKPLLSDVYGACDSLATRNKDDWRVTAKARRSLVVEKTSDSQASSSAYWNYGTSTAVVRKSVFVRIDALPANEMVISLSSLGLLNPLSIAWEKTYLSFVVDWFWPIGSFFDSLDAMLGYSTAAYSSSLLVRGEYRSKGKREFVASGTNGGDNTFDLFKRYVYLNRAVSSTVPLPMPPRLKDPRSLGHMANALALLAGAFAKYRK